MNNKILCIPIIGICLFALNSSGCKKQKKEENELITTVKVHLKKGAADVGTFTWKDADGDGGNPPQNPDTVFLDSGVIYTCRLEFLDESSNPVKDVTAEVLSEAANHRICFSSTSGGIEFTITDTDGKYPIGLQSEWKSKIKGRSDIRVVLRHQPNTKDGTCDPGDTDADVTFPVISK